MTEKVAKPGPSIGFGIFTLVMVALLVGLGVWQLQRRVWKHALIAALTERLATAPVPLPPASQWGALTPDRDEFRRVSFSATYQALPDVMVFTSGSAIRPDVSGQGTWAFVPARLASGETIVVNTGFVPNTMQDRAQQDRAVKPLVTGEPVTLTGYIRFPEKSGMLTPEANASPSWLTPAAARRALISAANAWRSAGSWLERTATNLVAVNTSCTRLYGTKRDAI